MCVKRKGFEMPVSVVIAIIIGVLFVAAYWASLSGFFGESVNQATNLTEAVR